MRPNPPGAGPLVGHTCGNNAGGARIFDLESQRVRGEVDADEHPVAVAQLTVVEAVGDQLADQQLDVVAEALGGHPGFMPSSGFS